MSCEVRKCNSLARRPARDSRPGVPPPPQLGIRRWRARLAMNKSSQCKRRTRCPARCLACSSHFDEYRNATSKYQSMIYANSTKKMIYSGIKHGSVFAKCFHRCGPRPRQRAPRVPGPHLIFRWNYTSRSVHCNDTQTAKLAFAASRGRYAVRPSRSPSSLTRIRIVSFERCFFLILREDPPDSRSSTQRRSARHLFF